MIILDISRGKDSMRLGNLLDVETETHRDWEICWMSRPRLIETEKFLGCRDRDSSRLRNLLDVETETHRDLEIWRMSRPRLIETGKFAGCRDRDQSRLGKRCRYRDSIETLVDLCFKDILLQFFLSMVSQNRHLKKSSCFGWLRTLQNSLKLVKWGLIWLLAEETLSHRHTLLKVLDMIRSRSVKKRKKSIDKQYSLSLLLSRRVYPLGIIQCHTNQSAYSQLSTPVSITTLQ